MIKICGVMPTNFHAPYERPPLAEVRHHLRDSFVAVLGAAQVAAIFGNLEAGGPKSHFRTKLFSMGILLRRKLKYITRHFCFHRHSGRIRQPEIVNPLKRLDFGVRRGDDAGNA